MDDAERAARFERLQVDIDTRLAEPWQTFWATELYARLDEDDRALVGSLMRAAYGVGYRDYHDEMNQGKPGELARANGYTKEA